jgi:putative peptidoglycan lipid II flippase
MVAVAVNVALKLALMDRYAQVGLAFATAVGGWVNLALLAWFAARRDLLAVDARLKRAAGKLALAGLALAAALVFAERAADALFASWTALRAEATLMLLAVVGAAVYFGIVFALFGRQWLDAFRHRGGAAPPPAPAPE